MIGGTFAHVIRTATAVAKAFGGSINGGSIRFRAQLNPGGTNANCDTGSGGAFDCVTIGSAGLIAGAGGQANATVHENVEADIAAGTMVNATGTVLVRATSDSFALADDRGSAGRLIGIGASQAYASLTGSVIAHVDSNLG